MTPDVRWMWLRRVSVAVFKRPLGDELSEPRRLQAVGHIYHPVWFLFCVLQANLFHQGNVSFCRTHLRTAKYTSKQRKLWKKHQTSLSGSQTEC